MSIKAICNGIDWREDGVTEENVIIIDFGCIRGYCLCMNEEGRVYHAKHSQIIIVDKEYLNACKEKETISIDLAELYEKLEKLLPMDLSKKTLSALLELEDYRNNKIGE